MCLREEVGELRSWRDEVELSSFLDLEWIIRVAGYWYDAEEAKACYIST